MNCCIFIGRLTENPELKVTPNGISVSRFTIAVDRAGTKDGDSADFFEIETWRTTAEFAAKYFHKGMRIAAKGEMHQYSYTDKQGIKRKAYSLTADKVEFADGKRNESNDQTNNGYNNTDDYPF